MPPDGHPTSIELTPEMSEIIERMRGNMSPQRFLALLLQVADSRAVSPTPDSLMEKGRSLTPLLTPQDGESCKNVTEQAGTVESMKDRPRSTPSQPPSPSES